MTAFTETELQTLNYLRPSVTLTSWFLDMYCKITFLIHNVHFRGRITLLSLFCQPKMLFQATNIYLYIFCFPHLFISKSPFALLYYGIIWILYKIISNIWDYMQIHLVGRSKEMVSHLYEYSDKAQCEILMSKFRNTIPSTHNKLFFLNLLKLQSTGINYRILYIKKKKRIFYISVQ